MRKYANDNRLWAVISGGLFFPIAGVWLVQEWPSGRAIQRFAEDGIIYAICCIVVGWVLHAVAVMCGVRLSRNAAEAEAADYDDSPNREQEPPLEE